MELYGCTVVEPPFCRVCGEQTRVNSGNHLGIRYDCPKGHFYECFTRDHGHYYVANGKRTQVTLP